jgi:hypothetical protein
MSGLASRPGVAHAGAGLLVAWGSLWSLATASAAQPIHDWPCDRPYAEHFAAEDIWGGRLPGSLPGDWQTDPGVRKVVEFAADPENTPNQGGAQIRAFATQRGADRRPALLGVFAGLLHEFDTQRDIVIEGVRDSIVRAKIVREAVDKNEAALAALPTDAGPAAEQQRKDQKEARFWNGRYMDDALDQARFLCHRYGYLEVKLRRLSAAIRAAW